MNITLFYILAGIIILGLIAFSQRSKLLPKRQDAGEVSEDTEEKITEGKYARVYDVFNRIITNEMIPSVTIEKIKEEYGTLGRMWNMYGQQLYAFVKLNDNEYKPAEKYFDMSRGNPPSRLYRALTQPSTPKVWDARVPAHFMQKWGSILMFVGFALFIMMSLVLQGGK